MTAVPPAADPEADGPEPGYYPDPSIPGYVRYWDGLGWTPGTSRPAPAGGEELAPPRTAARSSAPSMRFVPPPVPQRLLPPIDAEPDRTGPIFLDETGPVPEPRSGPRTGPYRSAAFAASAPPLTAPAAAAMPMPVARAEPELLEDGSGSRWFADAEQQRGLLETGRAPRWVSWGADAAEEEGPPSSATPRADDGCPVAYDREAAEAAEASQAQVLAMAQAAALASEQVRRADAARERVAGQRVAGHRRAVPTPVEQAAAEVMAEATAVQAAPTTPELTPVRTAAPAEPAGAVPAAAPAAAAAAAPAPAAAVPAARRVVRSAAPRPALLGRRLAARLLDTAVVGGAAALLGAQVIQRLSAHIQDKIDTARLLPGQTRVWLVDPQTLSDAGLLLLGLLAVGLVYEAVPTALWGRTLGKALFGLRVLDRRSKKKPGFGGSLARWLSYQLLLVLLVGVFDVAWCMVDRPWRQCWHDKIGRTFVAAGRSRTPREG